MRYLKIILITVIKFSLIFSFLSSCGLYKKGATPKMAEEKRRENIEQGKGISISRALGSRSTNYEFSTSNPLWRSSLEVLDFVPLNTVDYAGGIIITDWYSTDKNQSIKISIQFLTNEVTANSLKIIVFQKNCESNLDCKTTILNSKIKEELSSTIIKKAAILEKSSLKK